MTTAQLRAVLLDMDGLLVDSEPEWFEVEAALFARMGADREWTHDDARALTGNALEVSAAELARLAGSDTAPRVVAGWMVESMAERLARGVPFKPGAYDLLVALADSPVLVAVVSSSYRRLVDTFLAQLPDGLVQTSVAGDEVSRAKPHPDPYLTALARLEVAASHALVIEDSPTGASAGLAAGCTVVVVPDLAPLPETHSWHVADSLVSLDLAALVRLLGGDRR
jgi:HAD superfamily hydrolase (TIGR01509 family)